MYKPPLSTLSQAQRRSLGIGAFTGPRQRAPGEALPNTLSYKERAVYVPPVNLNLRPGSDDHRRILSRGR